jgi:palmitoyl-protein thioesterase
MLATTFLVSLTFLLTSVASHPTTSEAEPLPLVIWHGLGDNYAADGLADVASLAKEVNPGTYVYIIRLADDASSDRSATFFGNLTTQIQSVCDDLASHEVLSKAPAINALGFSQGGQFLRGYIERCNDPPVRNFVTFGSQHNGIAEFQACGITDWLCKGAMALLHSNTWSSFVQARLVPAQYYKSVNATTGKPTDEYLEYSNFLADINNERKEKNKTYKENMEKLENFAMYMFENDTVVIPKETSWWGQVNNLTEGTATPLKELPIYKEDWLGLKKLDEEKKLHFRLVENVDHMRFTDKLLTKVFEDFFAPHKHEKENTLKFQDSNANLEL